jgi:peptide deformylase
VIRDILTWPGDGRLLHQESVAVDFVNNSLSVDELVRDLFDTLYDADGLGLAAIQIGVPARVFVMDVDAHDYVFINPHPITTIGFRAPTNESCLSMPGVVEVIERYPQTTIKSLDRNGQETVYTFSGLAAQVVQHEYEHLQGIVLADKLSPLDRTRLAKKMAKPRGLK